MTRQPPAANERIRTLAAEIRDASAPYSLPEGSGRGLVVVAGGSRIFTNAYVLLHVLRKALCSRLPVELWHFGQAEMSPAMAALVEAFDVRLVDATPQLAATGADIRDGWQLKSFALAYSGFAEVLLLDADQVPISDPATCFDWPEYEATGAVFWPDAVDLRQENPVWSLLGLEARRAVSVESGQLLVDRRRHGAALSAALRLNEAANDLYQLIYGDKDTYLLAWEMLGAPYALVPHRPYRDDLVLVQRDFGGNALFQHRTNAKWQYGTEPHKIRDFVHEDACLAALSELADRWSGRVFTAPDRPGPARELERQLVDSGPFQMDVGDEPTLALEFRPNAEIGAGRSADRRHWWIEEADGRLQLILSDGDRRNYAVERGADHVWKGRRFRYPAAEASLFPHGNATSRRLLERPGLVDEVLRAGGLFGTTGYDEEAVANTLRLLAGVIPGVGERLAVLASGEQDPRIAARLRSLAEALGKRAAASQVNRRMKLETGYIRAEMDG